MGKARFGPGLAVPKGAKACPLGTACFLVLLTAAAHAAGPAVERPEIGGHRIAAAGRDVCWSEPADLNGLIASSEQILAYGLESEVANDFMIDGAVITRATWWGGYYGTDGCNQPYPPGFNLRFYDDADCLPGALVAFVQVTDFTQELVDCVCEQYPIYRWSARLDVALTPSTRWWFGAQMMDHTFPPQAGRLAAFTVTGCESAFKGAYFGYPDWSPCDQVFGVPFDASQEFECEHPTPAARSTWGAIRAMYR